MKNCTQKKCFCILVLIAVPILMTWAMITSDFTLRLGTTVYIHVNEPCYIIGDSNDDKTRIVICGYINSNYLSETKSQDFQGIVNVTAFPRKSSKTTLIQSARLIDNKIFISSHSFETNYSNRDDGSIFAATKSIYPQYSCIISLDTPAKTIVEIIANDNVTMLAVSGFRNEADAINYANEFHIS